jgi:methylglutaconyl-CoA hydratase
VPDTVLVEHPRPGVALLTLDRAERRNALSIALLEALVRTLDGLAQSGAARVAILRGAGPVFSAGLDLAEAANPDLVERSARCVAAALAALRHAPLVTVAAVHGGAYAGGAGLMAACDMAVGTHDLVIGFPEGRRGLLPALVCEVLRVKVRAGDLAELFLVGNTIDATRAREIGLLQRVVPAERLLDEALEMATGILAGGPATIVETKKLLYAAYDSGPQDVAARDAAISAHLAARSSPEAVEGLRAFREKRPPSWAG